MKTCYMPSVLFLLGIILTFLSHALLKPTWPACPTNVSCNERKYSSHGACDSYCRGVCRIVHKDCPCKGWVEECRPATTVASPATTATTTTGVVVTTRSPPDSSLSPWLIFLLVVAALVIVGGIAYFIVKSVKYIKNIHGYRFCRRPRHNRRPESGPRKLKVVENCIVQGNKICFWTSEDGEVDEFDFTLERMSDHEICKHELLQPHVREKECLGSLRPGNRHLVTIGAVVHARDGVSAGNQFDDDNGEGLQLVRSHHCKRKKELYFYTDPKSPFNVRLVESYCDKVDVEFVWPDVGRCDMCIVHVLPTPSQDLPPITNVAHCIPVPVTIPGLDPNIDYTLKIVSRFVDDQDSDRVYESRSSDPLPFKTLSVPVEQGPVRNDDEDELGHGTANGFARAIPEQNPLPDHDV